MARGWAARNRDGWRTLNDLSGRRFGRLTVIRKTSARRSGSIVWECLCNCGNTVLVAGAHLLSGQTTSCGCAKKGVHAHDLSGRRFGRLVALYPTEKRMGNSIIWACKCDCGKNCEVAAIDLENGAARSCGCLSSEVHREVFKITRIKRNAYYTDGSDLKQLGGRLRKSNTSGTTGVCWDASVCLWKAYITLQGCRHYLGGFTKKEDAIEARKDGEKLHQDFIKKHKK